MPNRMCVLMGQTGKKERKKGTGYLVEGRRKKNRQSRGFGRRRRLGQYPQWYGGAVLCCATTSVTIRYHDEDDDYYYYYYEAVYIVYSIHRLALMALYPVSFYGLAVAL